MAAGRASLSRRLLVGTIVAGGLILLLLALFGTLLFRSLSEQEIRRILVETRIEAEDLAQRLAGEVERQGSDLFTAIVQEEQTKTYIDRVLGKREIVQNVRIFSSDGTLVFENRRETHEEAGDLDTLDREGAEVETQVVKKETPYEVVQAAPPYEVVEVPVGTVGSFEIGISQTEMNRRVELLQRQLLRSAAPIAALTLVLLVTAYLFILWLLRRSRRLEGRAQEAERMAYVGTLASGLAHEIRSPLNSLSLNMQMLEEEIGSASEPPSRRLLAITQSEISRLESLVTDFLSYARPRPLELERVRAIDLLQRFRSLFAGQERAGSIEIEVVDRSDGAEIEVDPDQMGQLLLNLVQNGVAAAEEAGRSPRLELTALRQGNRVVLSVADNGPGIATEDRERVFDLFYSTRRGGTGLGLAIAKRIATAHGAEIRLGPGEHGGAVARVELPAAVRRAGTKLKPLSEAVESGA